MFNIGDTVYVAYAGNERIEVPCPVCYGKLKVTLSLGNGESVELRCDYCTRGCEGPYGIVYEYEYVARAEPYIISGMSIDGEKIEYHAGDESCYRVFKEEDCFSNQEEALEKAGSLKKQEEIDQHTRVEYLKQNKKKSFSWNAGYHLREAKRNREQVAYHEKMAELCKARSTEEKGRGE